MTPTTLRILQMLAKRRGDVGELARLALDAEGVPVDPSQERASGPELGRPMTPTERWHRWKANGGGKRKPTPEAGATNAETNGRTNANALANVRLGGGGGDLGTEISVESGSPSLDSSNLPDTESQRQRTNANALANVRGARTPLRGTNATADGAFGFTLSAWAGGVGEVTGVPFPQHGGKIAAGMAVALRDARTLFPGDECESARLAGRAYAEAKRGRELSEFDFGRWIGSGAPAGVRKAEERDPERELAEARAARLAEEKRIEANARRAEAEDRAREGTSS